MRGYHIIKEFGMQIFVRNCYVNMNWIIKDRYTVAVINDGITVGHLPRMISHIHLLFLCRGGSIVCSISGY